MLLQFRKLTRGAIATIILGLVGLAMVIFLVPNMDLGQLGAPSSLAEVGGRKVTQADLARELEAERLQQRADGRNVSLADLIEDGAHRAKLEELISRNVMYAYVEKLGVSASDTQVAETIRNLPATINPATGAFDETLYAQLLDRLSYSAPQFEERIRRDLGNEMVGNAMVSGIRAPSSFGAMVFAFVSETRIISIADAGPAAVGALPAPSDAQLQTLWEETQNRWRVPERRALTLVYARPQDFVSRVNVPEERLRQEFETRRERLATPERRSYVRISAQNQAQANDAAARLSRGENPDAVAAALGVQVMRGADQARTQVPDQRVAEAVFTQARGAVRVVQGQLTNWVVVRVEGVEPASEPRFEDHREELRAAIAAEEAGGLLNTAMGAFDDARGAGASVPEAARQAGLPFVSVPPVDARGADEAGAPVPALQGRAELLEIAFETPEGDASNFTPVEDADVVIGVDRIVPATVRPLAQVRDQLVADWTARERAARMRELGAQVVSAVQGGQSFDAAARARGFTVRVSSRPINREAAAQVLGPEFTAQVFGAAQGGVVTETRNDGGLVAVAQIEQINRVDPATQPQVVETMRARVEQGLAASIAQAAQAQMLADTRPRRNDAMLERLYPSAEADEDAQGQ